MGKIVKVSGPLVVATGLEEANMADVVRVGEQRLIGEILTMNSGSASIQVYEETSGLGPGAEVVTTGSPLSVELGPGLVENIYDGIQRPLDAIMKKVGGNNLPRGVEVPALDREKKWEFTATAHPGDEVIGGDIIGTVQETSSILHKIMIPPKMKGKLVSIKSGSYTVTETVAVLEQSDPCGITDDAEVAGACGPSLSAQIPAQRAAAVRPAYCGYLLPGGKGRYRGYSGTVRLWQDGNAACLGQVV